MKALLITADGCSKLIHVRDFSPTIFTALRSNINIFEETEIANSKLPKPRVYRMAEQVSDDIRIYREEVFK